jgi:hypothetical protein
VSLAGVVVTPFHHDLRSQEVRVQISLLLLLRVEVVFSVVGPPVTGVHVLD